MKTVICLLALLGVVQTGAAQQPALTWAESAGGRWAGRGVTDLSIPSLGLGPSTPRLRCCVPMSARWLGAAQEAEEEEQPPETPATRRAKRQAKRERDEARLYGIVAMGIGATLLVSGVRINCLNDNEIPSGLRIQIENEIERNKRNKDKGDRRLLGFNIPRSSGRTEYPSCITSYSRSSWTYDYEAPSKSARTGWGLVLFVLGALPFLSGLDLPAEVDARQDGIHLSKSFSW